MIVDTDGTRAGKVGALLKQNGFQASVCDQPLKAMGLMRRERPGAVVLEVVMPGRSGFELAARMQADPLLSRTPIVFTSDIQNSAEGNHDYFPRPLDSRRLVETLKKLTAG